MLKFRKEQCILLTETCQSTTIFASVICGNFPNWWWTLCPKSKTFKISRAKVVFSSKQDLSERRKLPLVEVLQGILLLCKILQRLNNLGMIWANVFPKIVQQNLAQSLKLCLAASKWLPGSIQWMKYCKHFAN